MNLSNPSFQRPAVAQAIVKQSPRFPNQSGSSYPQNYNTNGQRIANPYPSVSPSSALSSSSSTSSSSSLKGRPVSSSLPLSSKFQSVKLVPLNLSKPPLPLQDPEIKTPDRYRIPPYSVAALPETSLAGISQEPINPQSTPAAGSASGTSSSSSLPTSAKRTIVTINNQSNVEFTFSHQFIDGFDEIRVEGVNHERASFFDEKPFYDAYKLKGALLKSAWKSFVTKKTREEMLAQLRVAEASCACPKPNIKMPSIKQTQNQAMEKEKFLEELSTIGSSATRLQSFFQKIPSGLVLIFFFFFFFFRERGIWGRGAREEDELVKSIQNQISIRLQKFLEFIEKYDVPTNRIMWLLKIIGVNQFEKVWPSILSRFSKQSVRTHTDTHRKTLVPPPLFFLNYSCLIASKTMRKNLQIGLLKSFNQFKT